MNIKKKKFTKTFLCFVDSIYNSRIKDFLGDTSVFGHLLFPSLIEQVKKFFLLPISFETNKTTSLRTPKYTGELISFSVYFNLVTV